MAYQRSEYHREVQRDSEDRDNKTGGWRSWFGLDNKDDEHRDRGYNYQSTATYRNPHPTEPTYRTSYPERTGYYGPGYSGPRGGYGYTTSDEVSRGPWTADRDYTTRPSYGQPTGETYYKQETRTYGGDRDWTRPTGDYTSRSYTPNVPSYNRGTTGYTGERDYTTTTRDYPTSTYGRGYTSDYPTTSRGYTSDYPTTSRGYTSYDRDYPTTGRGYTSSYERDYPTTTSRGYGFTGDYSSKHTNGGYPETYGRTQGYRGDYYGSDNTYTRPSYQSTSYRY